MQNAPLVESLDRCYELSDDDPDDVLRHTIAVLLVIRDKIIEITGGNVFCDNVTIFFIFEVVQKLKHVGDLSMADLPHDLYLSVGLPQLGEDLLNIGLVDDFDRDLAPGVYVFA